MIADERQLPSGWSLKPIGDVLIYSQYGLSLPSEANGDTPIVGMKDLHGGYVDIRTTQKVRVTNEEFRSYQLLKGDILLNRTNSPDLVGKAGIVMQDTKAVFASYLVRLKADKTKADPAYINFLLNSASGQRKIKSLSTRAVSQANINPTVFRQQFRIPIPPLKEQHKIAAILSTWDEAIEKMERLIEGKEKRYKQLVRNLIVSPARINNDWKHLRIRDIADRVQRRAERANKEYPILTISSASGFVLQEEKYSRYMAGKSVDNYILLRKGEFAYNKGNSLRYQFGCIFELKDYGEAIVPHVYVCFRLHDDINSGYLSHVFAADYLRPQLSAIVKTGVRNNGLLNIRPDEFLDTKVPIPPVPQQDKIAYVLNSARQEIDFLKKQAEAYRKQKRGLMQKLLTGEWRVRVED